MSPLEALLLGVIQGLTEFLPISSSGHLVLTQHLLGLQEPPILFDIIVHVGTLSAVVIYFFQDLKNISQKQIKFIVIATLPVLIAGLILNPYLETLFSSLLLISIGFFITTIWLFATKFVEKSNHKINDKNALIIGLAQAVAIIPGISRSGSTVATGLLRKIDGQTAFTFSFLLSIPSILAALVLQLASSPHPASIVNTNSLVGFLSALLVGLLAIRLLHIITLQAKLHYFSLYTLLLALITLSVAL